MLLRSMLLAQRLKHPVEGLAKCSGRGSGGIVELVQGVKRENLRTIEKFYLKISFYLVI